MKIRSFSSLSALFILLSIFPLSGETNPPAAPASAAASGEATTLNVARNLPDAPNPVDQTGQSAANSSASKPADADAAASQGGHQTKRILYIIPNFRSVSSEQKLPPQTVAEKFKTASLDSIDYSSFIFVGAQAGVAMARKATPEFRQGAAGYGRYFWHTYADTFNENLWVEFVYPVMFREDSRFYTQNRGSFIKRLGYSASRVLITRTDSDHQTVNVSEILGAGTAAGISNLYYPSEERTFTKTYQRWLTSMAIDGGTFVFKEFWPDLNDRFFHQKD